MLLSFFKLNQEEFVLKNKFFLLNPGNNQIRRRDGKGYFLGVEIGF